MLERDLDDLLAEARRETRAPSDDFLARILADAEAEMPPIVQPPRRPASARRSWGVTLFGGGGLFAGLATATLAGIWIGVAQPAPVAAALWTGTVAAEPIDSVDLAPGYDLFTSLDLPAEG